LPARGGWATVGRRKPKESTTMESLLPIAEKIGALLKDRHETIAIAESTTGGLVSAALLSVAGASVYYIGGADVYTLKGRRVLLDLPDSAFTGVKPLTEQGALIIARAMRARLDSSWSMGELGAAGPTGSRYGEPAGTSVIAVAGAIERSITVRTGSDNRLANMRTFSLAALDLLAQCIAAAPRT
jgi:nicotinamide-nucleotide amidase